MDATRQFSITLPHDLASLIESKVEAGAYASVSDVLAEGVRALRERDGGLEHPDLEHPDLDHPDLDHPDLERWLREDVMRGHAEYLADPSRAVPAEEVMGRIKARRRDSTSS